MITLFRAQAKGERNVSFPVFLLRPSPHPPSIIVSGSIRDTFNVPIPIPSNDHILRDLVIFGKKFRGQT